MMGTLVALVIAWLAGVGLVGRLWPRTVPLPVLAWLGLAGLFGPAMIGGLLLVAGLVGLGSWARVLGSTAAIVLAIAGISARRHAPPAPAVAGHLWLVLVIAFAVGGVSTVAQRTHLGWDGTVVWFHKARMLHASDGVMPASTLADATRSWTAPDYPLQVPLAMAWVLRWQAVEDERAMKLLPAAWYAAVLVLIAAAVVERSGRAWPVARASAAVLVVATSPRLLVGEGSLTSGYADGPMAALLAALLWIAARSNWGRDRTWRALLVCAAICLAWTKQEGAVAVAVVAGTCVVAQRDRRAGLFAVPGLAVASLWQVSTLVSGAPTTMAYTFVGLGPTLQRVPLIVRGYVGEMASFATWGVSWPAVAFVLVARGRWIDPQHLVAVTLTTTIGAVAFLFSAWPDVAAHLQVTVGRQLVQALPAVVILAFGSKGQYPRT